MNFSCKLTEKDLIALQKMGEFLDSQPSMLYAFENYNVLMGPTDVTLTFSNGDNSVERWGESIYDTFLRLMLYVELDIAYHWQEVLERGADLSDEERCEIFMWVSKWHFNLEAVIDDRRENEDKEKKRFEFLLEEK